MDRVNMKEKANILVPGLIILLTVVFVAAMIISGKMKERIPEPVIHYGQKYEEKNYTTENLYREVTRFMDWMKETYGISCMNLKTKTPMRPVYAVDEENHLVIDIYPFCSYHLFYGTWRREFPYEEFSVPVVFRLVDVKP